MSETLESTINDNPQPSKSSLNSTRNNIKQSNISIRGAGSSAYADLLIHTPMIQIKVNDSILNESNNDDKDKVKDI
jgi:hypothetical protein